MFVNHVQLFRAGVVEHEKCMPAGVEFIDGVFDIHGFGVQRFHDQVIESLKFGPLHRTAVELRRIQKALLFTGHVLFDFFLVFLDLDPDLVHENIDG